MESECNMWYVKFSLICLIINLVGGIVIDKKNNYIEKQALLRCFNVTIFSFIPFWNLFFTLTTFLIIIESFTKKEA